MVTTVPPHAVETVLSGYTYLECPRWHEDRVWVSDFYTNRVISARADGSDVKVEADVPGRPAGLGWLPDGRLLIVSMNDRTILRREHDGHLSLHADLSPLVDAPLNELVADDEGRAYVGGFGFELNSPNLATSSLFLVRIDGSVTRVADGLWFPNAMMLTVDGRLLVNESAGNRVSSFAVRGDGTLERRHDWAVFGDLPSTMVSALASAEMKVVADGGCLDGNGAAWIADATHSRLLHVGENGSILQEIAFDTGVFACALGGAEGQTLFVCAAPDPLEEMRSVAAEGRLLALRLAPVVPDLRAIEC